MARLRVAVLYALAHSQDVVVLALDPGASAQEAVEASGIPARHPEIDPQRLLLGIFGKRIRSDRPLRDGDRVEILRPLATDPKEARRRRSRIMPICKQG